MLKRYSRILGVTAAVLMVVMMLAGCSGGGTLKAPAMKEGATEVSVTGSCDLTIDGDTITVSGETNLMAGTIVRISVESQSGMTLDSVNVPLGEDGKLSQEFAKTADKYGDTVASVTGHISCVPRQYGTQPTAVYEKYGSKFENIALGSDDILWNSNGKMVVFASQTVDLK
jgi:hypothetical protein